MNAYTLDRSLAPELWNRLHPFTQGYIETAFWLLTDENGESLNHLGLQDLDSTAYERMQADCDAFMQSASDAGIVFADPSHAGHDFWLTRNRHGAGFWDGDWPAAEGKTLTDLAHGYGDADLYLGDDGNLYHS